MVQFDIKSALPWLTVRRRPASTAVQTIIGKNSMDLVPLQLFSRIWHYPTNESLLFVREEFCYFKFTKKRFQQLEQAVVDVHWTV